MALEFILRLQNDEIMKNIKVYTYGTQCEGKRFLIWQNSNEKFREK